MKLKRLFDLFFSALALTLLAPFLAVIALFIKLESSGPVFYRQVRVGQFGRLFRVHKLRTMQTQRVASPVELTVGKDVRITRIGAFLRRYKIDEFPQLIDVLLGRMSIVGPRPEVPKYMSMYPSEIRDLVLSIKPGITDRASLEFRNENEMLATASDPEIAYIRTILPIKQAYYVDYVRERSFFGDIKIILLTVYLVFVRA